MLSKVSVVISIGSLVRGELGRRGWCAGDFRGGTIITSLEHYKEWGYRTSLYTI